MKPRLLNAALEKGQAAALEHEERLASAYGKAIAEVGRLAARRFTRSATSLTAAAPAPESTMVALYPTPDQATALVQPNGEPAGVLHVTVAYLGEIDTDQAEHAAAVIRELAPSLEPLEGIVGGIASFGSEAAQLVEIARIAGLVAPEGGYGQTLWNAETRTVLWIPADWTTDDEVEVAAEAFLTVPGVEGVEIADAESATPQGDEWELVWARNGFTGQEARVEPLYPSIVLPDVPGLAELRQAVCDALTAAGVPYAENHGYTAHLTIDYTPEPSPPPASLLGLPLTFDYVSLTRGDVARDFPLGQGALIAASPPPWVPPHDDEVVDTDEVLSRLRTKSDRVRRAAIKAAAQPALDSARIDWDVTNPFVSGVLEKTGAEIVGIADTTRLNVLRLIRESYEQGLSIPDTAKAIREGMSAAAPDRARTIARTELVQLANGGALAASNIIAQETGLTYYKRWLTAPGAPYPRHEDYEGLDGQTVALDDLFDVGGAKLAYPGDPDGPPEETIQCRCTLVYVESPDGSQSADDAAPSDSLELDDSLAELSDLPELVDPDTVADEKWLSAAAASGLPRKIAARIGKADAVPRSLILNDRYDVSVVETAAKAPQPEYELRYVPHQTEGIKNFKSGLGGKLRTFYDPEVGQLQPHPFLEGRQTVMPKPDTGYLTFEQMKERLPEWDTESTQFVYRGMSAEEMAQVLRTGEIRSRGGYNIGEEQRGLTFFGTDASIASSYAGGFAPVSMKPLFDRPSFIVKVKRPDADQVVLNPRLDREVGVKGAVPVSDIVDVIEVRPYEIEEGTLDLKAADPYNPAAPYTQMGGYGGTGGYVYKSLGGLPAEAATAPLAADAPTLTAPAAKFAIRDLSPAELKSASTDDLWSAMAENGKIDNLARSDVAAAAEDKIAAELWARGETDLPPGTLRSADVAGEGQLHSPASDGHDTIEQMARAAMQHGETQMTVTDHWHMLTPERIREQGAEIDRLNAKYEGRFKILKGVEANIRLDGTLDVPDDVLRSLDVVIAAIHEAPTVNTTQRFLRAMENPYLTQLAHPHSVDADWGLVAAKAGERNIALEVNGRDMLRNSRQETAGVMIAAARNANVPIAIGADAHRVGNLVDSRYAVRFAAEHGVTREDLIGYQRRPVTTAVPAGDNVSVPAGPFVPPEIVAKIDELGLNVYPPAKGPVAAKIFGVKADTEQIFKTSNGRWTESRAELHESIHAAHFKDKTVPPAKERHAFFTAGGGASGKGRATFLLDGQELTLEQLAARPDFVFVDTDRIKTMLPEYRKMDDAGEVYAASGVHEESSAIARTIVADALERGYSVVIDSTGAGGSFLGKLETATQGGYDVQVSMVSIPTNEAIVRAFDRGQETGRFLSVPTVKSAHQGAAANFELWKDAPKTVPNWRLFDNSGPSLELVAERRGGSLTVHDRVKYEEALEKANEPSVSIDSANVKPTEARMVTLSDGRLIRDEWSVPGQEPLSADTVQKIVDFGIGREAAIPRGPVAKKLLGDARDTEELYRSADGTYPPVRQDIYRKAVDNALEGHTPLATDSSYRGVHKAPGPDSGAPMSDLANPTSDEVAAYPPNVYDKSVQLDYYGDRSSAEARAMDKRTFEIINAVRGKPDAEVEVFRALPKDERSINPGDWVTPSKEYAEIHAGGEAELHAERGVEFHVISRKVRAGDLYTEANSIQEYGWSPKPAAEGPTILVTAGGGASGKSAGLRANPSLKPPDVVEVNPDLAMMQLPEWKPLWDADEPIAAAALHEEGSYVAKRVLDAALEGGYNILLDVVGDEDTGKFAEAIRAIKKKAPQYKIKLLMADAPTNVAIRRNVDRASDKTHVDYGRFVPIDVQKHQHRAAVNRIKDWWMLPEIDEWEIYRTHEIPGTLIAKGGGGRKPIIVDKEEWDRLMQKPDEEGPLGNPG